MYYWNGNLSSCMISNGEDLNFDILLVKASDVSSIITTDGSTPHCSTIGTRPMYKHTYIPMYVYIYMLLCYLYQGTWAIAMVTFDVPQEIYAHNMPVDSV